MIPQRPEKPRIYPGSITISLNMTTPAFAARRAKKAGKTPCITLPNGRQVSIRAYVKAWKKVKALAWLDPKTKVSGFDYFPMPAGDILAKFVEGTNDRINIRGGIRTEWPAQRWERTRRHLERTVTCECRWCGSALPKYVPEHERFCEASCRRSYY